MKQIKTEKGITLIALVITIVVLIVLAVVAIGSVRDSEIIGHAATAAKDYKEADFEEKIDLIFSSHIISSYAGENINYKKIVNEVLDIFNYPNINEETGNLIDEQAGITDLYTMTAENGLVNIVSTSQESLLRIRYNETSKSIKIEYNNKIWEYENFKLKSKEENKDVEYNAPEEVVGTEYKSGVWQYKKNESGTLTITKYLGTTPEELTDVVVPNRINGQTVEFFDGFGKNLTGTLTISKGLKTLPLESMNEKLRNIKLNRLVIEEDVIMQSGYFFRYGTINEIEIKDNVILNADTIFATVTTNNIIVGNNVDILYNGFSGCTINEKISLGNNCKIEKSSISAKKMIVGDNSEIYINSANELQELVLGDNVIINRAATLTALNNVVVGENINLKGTHLFSGAISLTNEEANEILRNSNKTINGTALFNGCSSLTDIIIPSGKEITVAGYIMFRDCTNLKKLTIEDNCKFLSGNALKDLKIEELIIGNNVSFSGYNTFSGCTLLENVTIGENCKLANDFFNGCGIKNVTIGKGTKGQNTTFLNCKAIENVIYYLTDEQINLCKEDENNVNKIITSEAIFQRIMQHNSTLIATFEEDKIVLRKPIT